MNVKKLSVSALLTSVSIIIPMFFPKLVIPPFTATLMAHVPIMTAICISTDVAVFVTIGTSVGFIFAFSAIPFGYVRSFTHLFFVLLACLLLKKKVNIYIIIITTGIVHAFFETVVIMLLFLPSGVTPLYAILILSIGSFAHHLVDSAFTFTIIRPLTKLNLIERPFNCGHRIP